MLPTRRLRVYQCLGWVHYFSNVQSLHDRGLRWLFLHTFQPRCGFASTIPDTKIRLEAERPLRLRMFRRTIQRDDHDSSPLQYSSSDIQTRCCTFTSNAILVQSAVWAEICIVSVEKHTIASAIAPFPTKVNVVKSALVYTEIKSLGRHHVDNLAVGRPQ